MASQSYITEPKVRSLFFCTLPHSWRYESLHRVVCVDPRDIACANVAICSLQGDKESMDWRMFFSESGKPISPWHDIPLSAGNNTYNFVCEIPKETQAKMECSLVRPNLAQCSAYDPDTTPPPEE